MSGVPRRYERVFGPLAAHHLCVTNAMREDLKENWGIRWAGSEGHTILPVYH